MQTPDPPPPPITGSGWEVAFALRNRAGESVCGDAVAVHHDETDLIVAVVDGLGHGPQAYKAAARTLKALEEAFAAGKRLPDLILRSIHDRIRTTRGVAMSLLHVNGEHLRFAGVGNVGCASTLADFRPFPREGILGYRFQTTGPVESARCPGWFSMFTDGITHPPRLDQLPRDTSLAGLPERLISELGDTGDDNGIAVVRLTDARKPHAGPDGP